MITLKKSLYFQGTEEDWRYWQSNDSEEVIYIGITRGNQ